MKAKQSVTDRDLAGLRAIADERMLKRHLCVTLEPRRRRIGPIDLVPYTDFLDALWSGEFSD
ncbi:MAG: hypothetical protein ABI664_22685 [bacterium]